MMIEHPSITTEMLGEGWGRTLDRDDALKSEYSSDISPVKK
jgi:hypothetical protein